MERFAGRFALVRPLGQGGMGQVWLALDLTNGTECALKRLELRVPRSERDSLRREFELLTHMRHPAVVSVFELGFAPDGTPFYTMEYVPGRAADLALAAGQWAHFFAVAARFADGLEALHAAGIVHGDVKPSNLLVLPGRDADAPPAGVRLVDLGLSALLAHERQGHRGTPGFAAPEVVRGAPLSVASDLYGLGATLFVLAVGVATGIGDGRSQTARPPQDTQSAALVLKEAAVPVALVHLILRLLAAAPETRPSGAREVRLELARMHPAARRSLSERLQTDLFVGRRVELAKIERWLALAPRGAPLLLLSGEPGVGKSSLLRELAVRATLAGRSVVSLSCAEGERSGSIARTLLLRLGVVAETWKHGVATSSEPRLRLDGAEPLQSSDVGALAEAAIAWGREIQQHSLAPLLLLDDFENLDELSRAFARRVVSSEHGGVFRWVWASATAFADGDFRESVLLEAGLGESLLLGALDREQSDRLLAARLQSTPPAELADAIWERCGGHPGLSVEGLRLAAEAGAVRESDAGFTLDRSVLDRIAWPADFEAAFARRLAELAAAPAAAAAALAVWGTPAAPAELAAIEPAADQMALDALLATGFVTVDVDGRYGLSPPGIARFVLSSITGPARTRLHRAALARPDLPPLRRFRHHRGAGDPRSALIEADRALAIGCDLPLAVEAATLAASEVPEVAAEWAERAGRLLLERGRYRESLPHLERAVTMTPSGPSRARRQHALSGAYLRTGATKELESLLAAALAEALPDHERSKLLVNRCAGLMLAGDPAAALELGRDALRQAEASGDGEAEGLALLNLGYLMLRGEGSAAATQELAHRASAAFVRAGHNLGRVRAASLLVNALWAMQRHDEAEQVCRAALTEAREQDLRLAIHELLRSLTVLLMETGRWTEARSCEEEGLRLALEEGWPGMAGTGLSGLMVIDALTGNPARALRRSRATLHLVRKYQRHLETSTLRALALVLRTVGRTRQAARAVRSAIEATEHDAFHFEFQWTRIEHGNLLARLGRWEQARRVWEGAQAEHPTVDSVPGAILSLLLGRAELRTRGPLAAETRHAAAERWLEGRAAAYAAAQSRQLRAEIALAGGEAELGAAAANESLAAFEALPAPADAAAAALEFARLAIKAGVAAYTPVVAWLHKAAAGFALVGDGPSRARALALAVDWHRRFPVTTPAVARDRDLLKSVGRLLDSLPDLSQLTREAMRLAVEQLDAERGVLLLADEDGVGLHPVVEHGAIDAKARDQAVSYSHRVVERVASSGGSVVIEDVSAEPDTWSHSMVELGLRSVLCVPLFVNARVVGAVYLDDSRRPETFGVAERALLEGFAHLLAVAIENSRGQDQVRRENAQLVGENLSLRREVGPRFRPQNYVGGSLAMRGVLATVERAAATSSTVLITGENGTGKELIARMLHHSGPRALKPFVAVNCGAIPHTLLESELFGILADIATGVRARAGRFVEADGGTLLLDEIGEMPISQQVALLRVLSEGAVAPVGSGRTIPVNVRVIAASNRDLAQCVTEGTFREDLWYRLNVIPIELPPLRERKADIPSLAQHFAAILAGQMRRELPILSPSLIAVLMQSDWPGNVRELQNYIERLMAMTPGRVLQPDPLPQDLQQRARAGRSGGRGRTLEDLVVEIEKQQMLDALDRHLGNQSRAARELGLTEQSLRYRLRKYGMRSTRRFRR